MVSEPSGGFEQFLECNWIFNFSSLFVKIVHRYTLKIHDFH